MAGFIGLHRCLLDKPIWLNSTPEQKTILIALLLIANHDKKEWEWKGKNFKAIPGQFVTSIDSIVKRSGKGISQQNVRSAIRRFEKFEFLTNESTKTGRLITIVNWGFYQNNKKDTNIDTNKEVTKGQQRGNKGVTSNNNVNNINNNIYSLVIDYLNLKADKNYKATTSKTKSLIDARVNEKYKLDDFKKVIDIKTSEWKKTDMDKFLRPETLFGNKFESYLNQKPKDAETKDQPTNSWEGMKKFN